MNKKSVGIERSITNWRGNDGTNNMKDYSLVQQQQIGINNNKNQEYCCSFNNNNNNNNNGCDLACGFSWPPRCYTCSFCKREFRSAQALGGHMNVHRRDRARLRQFSPPRDNEPHFSSSSSTLNLNLDPSNTNPNPNPPSRKFPKFLPTLPPSSSCGMGKWMSKVEGIPVNDHLHQHLLMTNKAMVNGCKSGFEVEKMKNGGQIGKLDLTIGLKQDLDLELRLGYI